MKMNEIEITIEGDTICLSQFNIENLDTDDVYITVDQAEMVAKEIIKLASERK